MKNYHVRRYAMIIVCFSIFGSCSKKDSNNDTPTVCNFGTNTVTTTSDVPVTYSASNKNSGIITSLTYLGPAGTVVVTSPTLPWSVTVTIPSGKPVNVAAVGNAPVGGSLYLTYSIAYTNGIITNTTGCGN